MTQSDIGIVEKLRQQILDELHEKLPYPTEACAIVRGAALVPDPIIMEMVEALERNVKASERVLAAMDAHNEKHKTHLGGPAFFEVGRAVAQGHATLAKVKP